MFADAHLAVALDLVSDARRLTARSADQLHVRDVDTALFFGDTTLGLALLCLYGLLHHHHVLDQDLAFAGEYAQNAPLLAFVASGDDFDGVVLLNVDSLLRFHN